MRTGIVTVTTHEVKALYRLYYRVHEVKDSEFLLLTSGVTSIPNFINFRLAILRLRNTSLQISCECQIRLS
jgi:predicted SprT family Zn-dependent metalloprotease